MWNPYYGLRGGYPWLCAPRCYTPNYYAPCYYGGYNPYYGGDFYHGRLQSIDQQLFAQEMAIRTSLAQIGRFYV